MPQAAYVTSGSGWRLGPPVAAIRKITSLLTFCRSPTHPIARACTITKMASRLKVVLGVMEFGRRRLVEDAACFEIMDKFLSKGYNEVDTALMYTGGKSEQVLGRYLQQTSNKAGWVHAVISQRAER